MDVFILIINLYIIYLTYKSNRLTFYYIKIDDINIKVISKN